MSEQLLGGASESGVASPARWGWRRVAIVTAVAVVSLGLLYAAIARYYHLETVAGIDRSASDTAIRYLRGRIGMDPHSASLPALRTTAPGPLWVSIYLRGRLVARHRAAVQRGDLRRALAAAGTAVATVPAVRALSRQELREARIRVDLMLGSGPVLSQVPLFFALSVIPGIDGLGLKTDRATAYVLPDDLYSLELFSGAHPFFFMPEFRVGLDVPAASRILRDQIDSPRGLAGGASGGRFFRFRVQSIVDDPGTDRSRVVKRMRSPVERLTRKRAEHAVVAGADYLLRQLDPTGKFRYLYYPLHDQHGGDGDYSLARHAGTTWFLTLALRRLGQPRLREAIRRSLGYLAEQGVPPGCRSGPVACIGSDHDGGLGKTSLGLVAFAEYQLLTGDKTFDSLVRRLGAFVLAMQRDDGSFCHDYRPATRTRGCSQNYLYSSGEAALALAKLHAITGEAQHARALERALDHLVGGAYDFFLGQFFIGEDHWTCIAAEAAFPVVRKRQYLDFCRAFGRLNRRSQVRRGIASIRDLDGAFVVTPFLEPHNTPVGSRTEANIATLLLTRHWGESDADLEDTVLAALRYLVDQQVRPVSAYLLPNPSEAVGGMMQSPWHAEIRIDYVQHASAALVRGIDLVPAEGWSP